VHRFLGCWAILILALVVAGSGCAKTPKRGDTPLVAPRMQPSSVALDVFLVQLPFGDPEANGPLWESVDEQPLAPPLRKRLAENGFRAGLVGTRVPARLRAVLDDAPPIALEGEATVVTLQQQEPSVLRRHLQLQPNRPGELLASPMWASCPILLVSDEEVGGQTFHQAQGLFTIRARPQQDGRIELEVLPELRHGDVQRQFGENDGVMQIDFRRPQEAFEELRMNMVLAPGEMFLVASRANREGSLGHRFLTRNTDNGIRMQRFVLLRVSQTQSTDPFPDAPTIEESSDTELLETYSVGPAQ
jgi:hypothetical protein